MSPLRVALVGIGSMGRHHARWLRRIPGVELVALVDRGGDPYGVADGLEVFAEPEAAVEAGIDAAVIAVPTRSHVELGVRFAAAGAHLLVEKPIASTSEEALRLRAAVVDADVVGAVGHVERFNPAITALRAELAGGRIGRLLEVEARRQSPHPDRIRDVGVGMDLAVHDLDLARWLAGGRWGRIEAATLQAAGHSVEDVLDVRGTVDGGVQVRVTANWISPVLERVLVLRGEHGTLRADTAARTLELLAPDGRRIERLPVGEADAIGAELAAFRDAVAGLPTDLATFDDGIEAVRAVEVALASAGRPIAVAAGFPAAG